MQYKQNIIDMKQWICPYAGEMCNANRFFGGQAGSALSRHRAEWATRGSANTAGNATTSQARAGFGAKPVANNLHSHLCWKSIQFPLQL